MSERIVSLEKDFVVIGGGLAGVCAAIAAARRGLKVALCHDRSVLGGNSSSECRVWICGATAMGFNRYADETGIVSELSQENLHRNPEGNPHLWDALLLDKVWAEENILLLLETRMTGARVEEGLVRAVTCEQFCAETTYRLCAPLFADCTGDGALAGLAGARTVMGNQDVCARARERYEIDETYASLGCTILLYVKRLSRPVRFVPPAFALPMEEIERALSRTGKRIQATDSGCDYWWLEYGGDRDVIGENEAIRASLTRLVYGLWNYIKNSGKFDAQNLTLEWVGSIPARRESRRVLARRTLTEEDILARSAFEDAVCHGGWPIDTHPSAGFFDPRESCAQLPVDPYGIPLSSLICRDLPNVLLAGRDAGMTHLAMASARVMKTCAVEGQAIGTAAAFARQAGALPADFSRPQLRALQAALTRDDVWIPGHRLPACQDLAQRMRVCASAPIAPDAGPAARFSPLHQAAFVLLPPLTEGTRVALQVRAEAALAGLPCRLALYESGSDDVYKPTSQLDEFSFVLAQGEQALTIPCPRDTRGNACIRLPALAGLSVGLAREPLPGMLGVRAENALGTDLFAPAVRIERMDGWYACETLTDGYTRPYGGMRMWASPLAGSWAELTADEPQAAGELAIYLDNALYRSYNNLRPLRDPLWRRFLHPALLRDFTVHLSGPDGEKTLRVRENIQRLVRLDLGGMRVSRVRVLPERTWGASYAAIHELALFAPERKSAYGTL